MKCPSFLSPLEAYNVNGEECYLMHDKFHYFLTCKYVTLYAHYILAALIPSFIHTIICLYSKKEKALSYKKRVQFCKSLLKSLIAFKSDILDSDSVMAMKIKQFLII